MEVTQTKPLSVAVYSPEIQGFYFGELIGQIQQLCLVKDYRFTLIHTKSFGTYGAALGLEHFDIVLLLRNAVHPSLVAKMVERKIAVVSIAFDYFPLNVPYITCDNDAGIELGFNMLRERGHQKMAFIGDLSQLDLRQRYEAFCSLHDEHGLPLDDAQIYSVSNTLFSGGFDAAESFVKRNNGVTAVICGAGLTAIGFSQQLRELDPSLREYLDIIAFDAVSLMPVFESGISIIDQNMVLLAYKTMEKAEQILRGEEVTRHERISPKLIDAHSELISSDEAFLATAVELGELHNPNYMKSLLINMYEWPRRIASSQLDEIMMLSPLFPRHMHEVLLSRVLEGDQGQPVTRVVKHFSRGKKRKLQANTIELQPVQQYPSAFNEFDPDNYGFTLHIPIFVKMRLWGVLSVFGKNEHGELPSSISALCGYLSFVAEHVEQNLLEMVYRKASVETTAVPDKPLSPAGKIHWRISSSHFEWDKDALEMLGYFSDLEHQVYGQMEITDRLHAEDVDTLQTMLAKKSKQALHFSLRFRHKNRNYIKLDVSCQEEESADEVVIIIYAGQEEHE